MIKLKRTEKSDHVCGKKVNLLCYRISYFHVSSLDCGCVNVENWETAAPVDADKNKSRLTELLCIY